MKKNYWLICLGVAAAALIIFQFVPRQNWGIVAIILFCPAMHLLMMKGMGHGEHKEQYS